MLKVLGCMSCKEFIEGIGSFIECYFTFGNNIKHNSKNRFQAGRRTAILDDDNAPDVGFRQYLFNIAEIGVRTHNGICLTVPGDIAGCHWGYK